MKTRQLSTVNLQRLREISTKYERERQGTHKTYVQLYISQFSANPRLRVMPRRRGVATWNVDLLLLRLLPLLWVILMRRALVLTMKSCVAPACPNPNRRRLHTEVVMGRVMIAVSHQRGRGHSRHPCWLVLHCLPNESNKKVKNSTCSKCERCFFEACSSTRALPARILPSSHDKWMANILGGITRCLKG